MTEETRRGFTVVFDELEEFRRRHLIGMKYVSGRALKLPEWTPEDDMEYDRLIQNAEQALGALSETKIDGLERQVLERLLRMVDEGLEGLERSE